MDSSRPARPMRMEAEVHKALHIVYQVPCTMDILGFSHDWSDEMKFGDGPVRVVRLNTEGRRTLFKVCLS